MRRINISTRANNFMIDFLLDEYKEFIEFNNKHFTNATKDIDNQYLEVQEYIEKNKDIDDPGYISAIEDNVIDKAHTLRNYETIFRTSVIIQVYTFMEIQLKRFCRSYANIHGLTSEFELIFRGKESDLTKSKQFINNHLPVKLTSSPKWHFITLLSSLRNQLVHHGHLIQHKDKRYSDIENISKGNFKLECNQHYSEIIFENNKFLFKIIENIRELFKLLSDY